MIIHAVREFCGYELNAVVSAESHQDAVEQLGWSINEDTTKIDTFYVGRSMIGRKILAEECL